MSGHSKWSKVKHQKAVTDAAKSTSFTKASRAITIAVVAGGGLTDADGNFRLRLAISLARSVNMPKDTIERAIERAKTVHSELASVFYEGYGPGGVAILAEALTDNKQRTAAHVKYILDRSGGSLGRPGSVSFLFRRMGSITVSKKDNSLDGILGIALEVGADDVKEDEKDFLIFTRDVDLHIVATTLREKGIAVGTEKLVFRPMRRVEASDEVTQKNKSLARELDDNPDIQNVYTNL